MKMKLKRVYKPYTEWEELEYNMWGTVSNKNEYLEKAIEFIGNYKLYGSYMLRVIKEWPVSCENSLTDYAVNRKAWIGQAACALALKCPENITRQAWKYLTYEQQLLANTEARRAIARWENDYRKSKDIYKSVGTEVLSFWDS